MSAQAPAPASGRRKARELAFRVLFQANTGNTPVLEVWDQTHQELHDEIGSEDAGEAYGDILDRSGTEFAGQLVRLFSDNRAEVDRVLEETVEGWTFGQMNQTDLNVMRLAVTELLYVPDSPAEVAIEMAVRLARKFGGEESGKFVNGVLARVFRGEAYRQARGG